jgi:hypothetical protein
VRACSCFQTREAVQSVSHQPPALHEISDGAGPALVADEAHHGGGVIRGQAFKHAKFIQAKPNKTKQKSFDFLGFPWPNRDFSMGYGESK